jgi:hypothetical protein
MQIPPTTTLAMALSLDVHVWTEAVLPRTALGYDRCTNTNDLHFLLRRPRKDNDLNASLRREKAACL